MKTIIESAAETAKKIRKELKVKFPGIKFSVRSQTYSGGSSVTVSWTDGPMPSQVDDVLYRFKSASFDGMQDLETTHGYEYEGQHYIGAKYVSGSRKLSDAYHAKIKKKTAEKYGDLYDPDAWGARSYEVRAEREMLGIVKKPAQQESPPTTPEPPKSEVSNVVNFTEFAAEKQVKSFEDSMDAERRLKLAAVTQLIGEEKASEALTALNFDIDKLFSIAAKIAYQKEG